jgi:hypothetical protein
MFYQQPRYLTEPLSNNAFDFEERKKLNPHPQIYIPELRPGPLSQATPGRQIVFESIDENGQLQSCPGLQFFLQTDFQGIPTYLFDNHNHAFFFWHWQAEISKLNRPLTLIHLDQHKDTRIPAILPESTWNLAELEEYTNTYLNVGNFIPPALKTGLINQVVQINSEEHLENWLTAELPAAYIFDLDLDFFAPELSYIPWELSKKVIQRLSQQAKIITIATSPFFIDQQLALEKMKQLFC